VNMNLPGPSGRDPDGDKDSSLNTVGNQVNVLGYAIDVNMFAAICYLPLFPFMLIPCFIALNTKVDNPDLLRFSAVQSLMVTGIFVIAGMVLGGLGSVFGFIPLLGPLVNGLLNLVNVVLLLGYIFISLKGLAGAYRGNMFRVPFIAPYADQFANR